MLAHGGQLPDLSSSAVEVAPQLLGCVLRRGRHAGVIVEVEAYGAEDDPASHAYRGPTPRTKAMFGPPGGLYVYLIYGMHLCANVVCCDEGTGGAVLIRALRPVTGLAGMRRNRPKAASNDQLCSGPGKLTAALGIRKEDDGLDMMTGAVRLEPGERIDGSEIAAGPRIGISKAVERPWRFAVVDDVNVSRPRPVGQ